MHAAVVGAGVMGSVWTEAIAASPDVRLAAVVDIDPAAASQALAAVGVPDAVAATSVTEAAAGGGIDFVVDATVPAAHLAVTAEALRLGLPVLGEKPLTETLPQALTLAALAELTGTQFVVSQSRRFEPNLVAFKEQVGRLGAVGTVSTEFYRAPRFGGFRETMPHPLLLDMAIHAFDTARYLLDDEPVRVYCDAFNPPWSWFVGDASASASFRFASGARYAYTASWCAEGFHTSWNGSWRVSGEHGTALWDGDHAPVCDVDGAVVTAPPEPGSTLLASIAGSLAAFVDALSRDTAPATEVHRNVLSLAMVLCAVESAASGAPVLVDDALAAAHEVAVREASADVAEVLRSWPSVGAALSGATRTNSFVAHKKVQEPNRD
jgi:predicted dehydrogenase